MGSDGVKWCLVVSSGVWWCLVVSWWGLVGCDGIRRDEMGSNGAAWDPNHLPNSEPPTVGAMRETQRGKCAA